MSAAVTGSLALGIAANTAVFSFVNAIQFKPLPVADESALVDASVVLILAAIGCGASWLPSRKATPVDPLTVLRHG